MKVRSRRVLGKNGSISLAIPPFYSGLFINGGFENGLTGWEIYGGWVAGDSTADNPGTLNDILYQNFTLEEGATYEISADNIEGDAIVDFMVNDADSGANITLGAYRFIALAGARSTGVFISVAGTVLTRIDNLKLVKLFDANVVLYEGEPVTYNGEPVTYTL